MQFAESLQRMRRMLRDPYSKIWTDAQLRHIYNQEQQIVFTHVSGVSDVRALRIPPSFQTAYNYDWEWAFSDHTDGEVIQLGYFDDAESCCYTALWEAQALAGIISDVYASGDMWAQPWEAWMCDTPAEPPPIPAPDGFHKALGIYWDKDPIDGSTLRETMDDQTWRTRGGDAMAYYRQSGLEDFLILHPRPGVVDWNDDFDIYLLTDIDEIIVDENDFGIEV